MHARFARAGAGAATAFLAILMLASPASAHEHRVIAGKYSFTVGWGDEPAWSGFKNSIQLILSDTKDKPITDLGDTLKVEVSTGTQKTPFPITPNFEIGEFGTPGDYRAWMVPTRPGTYTFHFTGTIHGDAIDESFTSGDKTFDNIDAPTDAEFPAKDPTLGDLSQKLDRIDQRLAASTTATKKARDKGSGAQMFAIVGIVVGGVGVLIGLGALTRKR
jgi:hypothetical protein